MAKNQEKRQVRFLSESEIIQKLENEGEYERYRTMGAKEQKFFMDFCTGKSMKALTYDAIFKRIFNYDRHPRRLEEFLSEFLGFSVKIIKVLPVESERMVEAGSVLIMDIVVQAQDGSLINVEMQKCPYKFAGERDSCYLSNLVIRQYNDIKKRAKEQGKIFNYREMKPVYSIIIVENSYGDMLNHRATWEHVGSMRFEDDLKMNFLENIHYIRLDNFRKIVQNVSTKKEQWIYLLSANTPERVLKAAAFSDEMFEIVSDIAAFVRDISEVVNMFSDVLQMMDRNTEKLMYDELMEDLEKTKAEVQEKNAELKKASAEVKEKKEELKKASAEVKKKKEEIVRMNEMLHKGEERIKKEEERAKKEAQKAEVLKLLLKGCSEDEIVKRVNVTLDYIRKLQKD